MQPQGDQERDQQGERDQQHERERGQQHERGPRSERGDQVEGPNTVGTDDPAIMPPSGGPSTWIGDPDQSMSIETNRIRGPSGAFHPNFVLVPVESSRPCGEGNGREKGQDQANANKDGKEKTADQSQQGANDGSRQKDQNNSGRRNGGDTGKTDQTAHRKRSLNVADTRSLAHLALFWCGIARVRRCRRTRAIPTFLGRTSPAAKSRPARARARGARTRGARARIPTRVANRARAANPVRPRALTQSRIPIPDVLAQTRKAQNPPSCFRRRRHG